MTKPSERLTVLTKAFHQFMPFVKYCIVGGSGTALDVAALYIFIEYAGIPLLPAASLSFTLAVINNFVWNKLWTFRNKSSNYRKLFIKFFLVSLGGLALTNVSMYLQVVVFGLWYIYAKLITSLIVLVWNFLANKYWTFQLKARPMGHAGPMAYDYSIVIPAYNEEKRLTKTLRQIHEYRQTQKLNAEIIVVDDGSEDGTAALVESQARDYSPLRLVHYAKNRGKGYAVRQGVQAAQGKNILFTDADNSTPIEELETLAQSMKARGADIAIGSRYLKESRVKIKQSRSRILIGRIGNALIRFIIIDGIRDTQCGFKLFKHEVAKDIFSRNKINGWGFDMEVLAIANMEKYRIIEVPVSWYNAPDSRLRPIRDAMRTFWELILIKLNIWCGRYDVG